MFDQILITSKSVKNTALSVVFSIVVLVFGDVVKHGLSCLLHYLECLVRLAELEVRSTTDRFQVSVNRGQCVVFLCRSAEMDTGDRYAGGSPAMD